MEGGVGDGDNDASEESGVPQVEYPIHILHDDDEAAVDIVAVHGLGANPKYAWAWLPKNNPPDNPNYPEQPLNWLKDLLPSKLLSSKLRCRVMTFNYESKWFLDAPQVRLSNISDNLLDSLRNNRTKATNRPLIFIGHSFGGNLIEQAIVSSRLHSEYKHIAESTVGVIFLGTPHRGSEAAKWGVLIASLGGLLGSTEKRILKDLQKQSGTLTDRLHDFSSWLFSESVPVVCYWEQLKTDYSTRVGPLRFMKSMLKEVVVDETSACIDGHKKISLHTDHFKINKFYGRDDPSFLQVYPEIVRMAESAEEMLGQRRNPTAILDDRNAQPEQLLKFLRAMKVMSAKDVLSDIKRRKGGRVGNTCEWILKREEFSAWGAVPDPQLFFIAGSPGIGKTMMSTFLVDELQKKIERVPGKALAYFFCDDKDQDRKTPIAILRSLIWQILLQKNDLFDKIQPEFDVQGSTIVESFSTLWRILDGILRDERAGEVFILIDAFDECDKVMRKELLTCIRELFQSSSTAQTGKFKFLLTSRPENDILEELNGVGTRLLMNSASVNNDLSMYIDFTVDQLAKRKGYAPALKEMVQNALKNEAEGTFLWVSLMVADLEKEPKYNVKHKLKGLPKGLNETYARILNENISMEAREDVQFLLLSMVAARRPFKKREIASAFAVWKDGLVLSSQDVDEYADICLLCSSIIYLDGGADDDSATINFCHQSVKDFLLDGHGESAWYHTSGDRANLALFQVCWTYLVAEDFHRGGLIVRYEIRHGKECCVKVGSRDLKYLFPKYAFLQYASEEWEEHAMANNPVLFDMFTFSSTKDPVKSYPRVLCRLKVDVAYAPTLQAAWLLHVAKEGQEGMVALLHARGANFNVHDTDIRTPLSWASYGGHEAVVRLILNTGEAWADSKDNKGRTPLSWAAKHGHEAITKLLLSIGKADPNSMDRFGRSPLSHAAEGGHGAVARLLLNAGSIKPDLRDKDGWSPLSYAARNGHEAVTRLLLDIGEVDPNSMDTYGWSPLAYAARGGHESVARLLLNIGSVDPDLRNIYGQSPLFHAVGHGHEAVVRLLLNIGSVDPDSRNKDGQSPLSVAATCGLEAIARLLLSIDKVEADSMDKSGRSPLSLAARWGSEAVTGLLLDEGEVEADSRDKHGQSPLSFAARAGHTGVARLLLSTGKVEADSKDKKGQSPLWWTVHGWGIIQERKAIAELLLDTGKVEFVAGIAELLDITSLARTGQVQYIAHTIWPGTLPARHIIENRSEDGPR
ncbi:hypothetical protein VE00_03376 [Pseudogymnoascus sp. WSF 3629]|nr:hypothetical protein VE00_03376 [Pseudogymnoascus sp. WSF 3629]